MRRFACALAAAAVMAVTVVPVVSHGVVTAPSGVPDGVPPAALRPEPALPVPDGWPFPESFPRTSGFGRLDGGAFYWTGYLYDDYGARGVPNGDRSGFAVTAGQYGYPDGPAAKNGADLFRIGIGLDATSTFWRVDWNTLLDAAVPIAAFGFDTDASTATGTDAWPANAAVRSAGLDRFLVVSGAGAWLYDEAGAVTEVAEAGGAHQVDMDARSFVVRVPREVLTPDGTWTARVVAGLADATGRSFARPRNALPTQPAVYNVGFRAHAQELAAPNDSMWFDAAQAGALLRGDVSEFAATLDWSALAAHETTPEPRPAGYSNRWYVSSIELGQGWIGGVEEAVDGLPNYLGRVQPYAIYVPSSYDGSKPVPLTWMLHSHIVNHNQYFVAGPRFQRSACEDRGSICVTPLGRGIDMFYMDEAELDFWEVWHDVADHYTLDTERTVLSGFSMGGWGTYKLGATYPDLFAGAVVLAGPPNCGGLEFAPGYGFQIGGTCKAVESVRPFLPNIRWVPYYIGHGIADELVPVSGVLATAQTIDELGYRYRLELYPEGHSMWQVNDIILPSFTSAAEHMNVAPRVQNPPRVTFVQHPALLRPDLGIGSTGAYWVRDVSPASNGSVARVDARSYAIPEPPVALVDETGVLPSAEPAPAIFREQSWEVGDEPPTESLLEATLSNVSAVTLDLRRAGLGAMPATIAVQTDGASALTLRGLIEGTEVTVDGAASRTTVAGRWVGTVPAGAHEIHVSPPPAGGVVAQTAGGELPATGAAGPVPPAAVAFLIAAAASFALRRRV